MIDTSDAFITLDFAMGHKIKKGLFSFLFIVLLLPFIQYCLPFIDSGKLYGYFNNAPDINFSFDKWFDGSYQNAKTNYLNDHVGFRPDLLRINGQIHFSLFNKPDCGGIVMDKDNSLYYDNYIDALVGKDFAGYPKAREKLSKLKALQDTFARRGKSLIMVYSPSKAFYNAGSAGLLAEGFTPRATNLATYLHIGDSLGLNQVDLNTWFVSLKGKTKDSVFTKQGIHWTEYGAILAADSVIRYMERLRKIRMAHPTWQRIEHTNKPRSTDNDVAAVLNLIFPVDNETFSYPQLIFARDTTLTRPRTIFIGDSFVWTFITTGINHNVYSKSEFWDYFGQSFREDQPVVKMPEYNWAAAIDSADCVVLMYNSINLPKLGDGFIEQAYQHYYPAR